MKELFYSNGVDIFGPVTLREFCRNRYYKSTLIWHDGLTGWVSIEDCEDLKHLIGTMDTPVLDSSTPQALPNLTPPLSKIETPGRKSGSPSRVYAAIAAALFIMLMALVAVYFNNRVSHTKQAPLLLDTFEAVLPVVDTVATKEAALVRKAQKEAEMKTHRLNWEKFILAVPNKYRQKDIGGIEDLKVIVRNTSPYKLDKVKVKVSYIKKNGNVHKTEMIEFDNVDSNSSKELFAPNSDRGVKVQCAIMTLTSQAMNLCIDKTAKGFAKKNGEDPYRCN